MTASTVTFPYKAGSYTFIVPDQCTSVRITAKGAGGGGTNGGSGAYARATYTVVPGDVLYIYPGGAGKSRTDSATPGAGGFNGGGSGGAAPNQSAAGGGGASDVRKNGTALTDRIIVAGGGGGAAPGSPQEAGGDGGDDIIANDGLPSAFTSTQGQGGKGAGVTFGGAGGLSSLGVAGGVAGALGVGGRGSNHISSSAFAGGGGGGGKYGGGGGGGGTVGGGGGGGGSSDVFTGTSKTLTVGGGSPAFGNGVVTVELNYKPNQPVNLTTHNPGALDQGYADITQDIVFGWSFSDPDPSDSESLADLRWRVGSGAWTTLSNLPAGGTYTAVAGTFASYSGQTIEWQVRDYDNLGAVSDWSASRGVFIAPHPPQPTFVTPPVMNSQRPVVAFTSPVGDPEINYYQLHLVSTDDPRDELYPLVQVRTDGLPEQSITVLMPPPATPILEHKHYAISVRIARYPQVWSDWLSTPSLEAVIDGALTPTLDLAILNSQASIRVSIVNPGGDSFPPTSNTLYRQDLSVPNSEEITLAVGLPVNGVYVDRTPASQHIYRYRAEAINATTYVSSE